MKIEIITIGDELLLGFGIDTNAAFLGRTLADVGVEIVRRATVGDDAEQIADAVRAALERSDGVITTGGLGPTADDLTKPAIAALFGRQLVMREDIVAAIEARFRSYGFKGPMPASNRQQALVPEGARVLENHHGSAPGIWLENDRGKFVAMLPGVPREMRGMTHDVLMPLLRERAGDAAMVVRSRTLRCAGISESALADRLGDRARRIEDIPVAYLPGLAGIDLRLTVRGRPDAEAAALLDTAIGQLKPLLGDHLYGEEDTDIAEIVLGGLRERNLTLGVAESCTGGMLGARLTAIPGSSDVFRGGIVAYANEIKEGMLGVSRATLEAHGAVSEPVVREMANGAIAALRTTASVAITGIAGPGGGSEEKPVGLVWIAARIGDAVRTSHRVYPGNREEIRHRAAQAALDLLRRMML